MLFSDLPLKNTSLKAIEALGFKEPTEIQEKSIPILAQGDVDFVGQAQTGTGKTAAFALPLLEKIDFKNRNIQALIMAPTRELANQICEEIKKLSKFEEVSTMAVYGGTSVSGQIRNLKRIRPQILVGTPGRLCDFINRSLFNFDDCNYIILDEADEMLDMGFFDDVEFIIDQVPNKRIWMFSATMPKQIIKLVNGKFNDPEHVKITKKVLTADSVSQQFCVVRRRDQAEALARYLDYQDNYYAIIFTQTKMGASKLTDELNFRGFKADSLHGDMSQDQRDLTMKSFKDKKVTLLVCTDVAARGIDVNDLTHVINFSFPQDNESYVHRIGRTGRGGSKGIALSIITPDEKYRIKAVERITKANIESITLPTKDEIMASLTKKSLAKLQALVDVELEKQHDCLDDIKQALSEVSQDDLIKMLSLQIYKSSLSKYANARDLDVSSRDSARSSDGRRDSRRDGRRDSRDRRDREYLGDRRRSGGTQTGFERFFVNVGRSAGTEPGDIVKFVARGVGISGSEVGRIDIKDTFSFFEVPQNYSDKIMNLNNKPLRDVSVNIEVAKRERGPSRSRSRSR